MDNRKCANVFNHKFLIFVLCEFFLSLFYFFIFALLWYMSDYYLISWKGIMNK